MRRPLYLQRSDRRILLALLIVATVALTVIWFTGGEVESSAMGSDSLWQKRSSRSRNGYRHADRRPIDEGLPERQVELFAFDPNTADSIQLLRLGLQRWQVRNIYRYRRAGGVYRRPQDFARLYGLTAGQYRQLEPYIRISPDFQPASRLVEPAEPYERDTLRYPVKLQAGEQVVLNTADTAELRRVPGIGVYFAREIVNHGRFLGGYVSVDQLDEIPDFPQQSKQYFVVSRPSPRRLNLNRLTLNELRRHPYINYHQARAILDFRRLHGRIDSLQQLRLSKDFPPDAIRRLLPYVEY